MSVISIREQGVRQAGPALALDGGVEYPLGDGDPAALTALATAETDKRLAWYFERYPAGRQAPSTRVEQAAASLTTYGEALFELLFRDRAAFTVYHEALQAGELTFEVVGSPAFHAYHWETLKDPRLPTPLALRFPFVRRNIRPQVIQAEPQPSPTLNILLVSARPDGPQDAAYRTISRPLVEALRQTALPVRIDIVRPGTYRALLDRLEKVQEVYGSGYYHILHFDVHGAVLSPAHLRAGLERGRYQAAPRYGRKPLDDGGGDQAFLFFEGDRAGRDDLASAQELADLLIFHQIPIVVLNACQSARQLAYGPEDDAPADTRETSLGAQLMQAGAQTVIAMAYKVTVSGAQRFMTEFYAKLFDELPLSGAVRQARLALYHDKTRRDASNAPIELEDWMLPVVYQNREITLKRRQPTPAEMQAIYGAAAARTPPGSAYGFVGRDREILAMERRLLPPTPGTGSTNNILRLSGPAGMGKSALVQHLAWWWPLTDFVEDAIVLDLAATGSTIGEIANAVAQQALNEIDYVRDYKPLRHEPAGQALLAQRMRGRRRLLLLDDVDALPAAAQEALGDFLAQLAGGKTLVLLVSRGPLPLLDRHAPYHAEMVLPPLDELSVAELAGRVLDRADAGRHRDDPELASLLDLCGGHPGGLIWLVAALNGRAPGAVADAFLTGAPAIDDPNNAGLTASSTLLDTLSGEQQQLTLALAPFAGPIDGASLPEYAAQLAGNPGSELPWADMTHLPDALCDLGLAGRVADAAGAVQLTPPAAYLLRRRLTADPALESVIPDAYCRHYEARATGAADKLAAPLLTERRKAQAWVGRELANLVAALARVGATGVPAAGLCRAVRSYCFAQPEPERDAALAAALARRPIPADAPAAAALAELTTWLRERSAPLEGDGSSG